MTTIQLTPRWGVTAETRVILDGSANEAWAVMQDLSRFISADPYHTRMTDEHGHKLDHIPPRGTKIRTGHGISVTFFDRVGTMTRVVPNQTIAFTDLSKRGPNVGFPHVYKYELIPLSEHRCELKLTARGRWSARWMPRGLVHAWLWWVMAQANWSMRMHTGYEIKRQRQHIQANNIAPSRKAIEP